jgi:M3 family oligoendopeptidase
MQFNKFPYQRPNIKKTEKSFLKLFALFNTAKTADEQIKIIDKINRLRIDFWSMQSIATIRHSINTADKKYLAENNFFDLNSPIISKNETEYFKLLLNSKFKKELILKLGKNLFAIADVAAKTFDPKILNLLKKENQLCTNYTKLIASVKIKFQGKIRNLAEMKFFSADKNRAVRKAAQAAKYKFFKKNSAQLDSIFDKLVKLRHRMAKTLGYKNFIELGYYRRGRTEWTEKEAAVFRAQIKKHIVPLAGDLKKAQAKRLGLKKIKYYDEPILFLSGNVQPIGDTKKIIADAGKMFNEMSRETKTFFKFMRQSNLMDLETRKNKAFGGFCDFIMSKKAPFIFSNFNNTLEDIDVLTHESGHALQCYLRRDFKIPEYINSTAEINEIHSMSMELFTLPWMKLFFGDDALKYEFSNPVNSISGIPYIAAVDEFQHFVYKNHQANPLARNKAWRKIEKKYLPWRDYEDNKFCNNGGFWQQQLHIYISPFYYLDYAFAQICAFQFLEQAQTDRKKAWTNYLALCKKGGSEPASALLKIARLVSPFKNATEAVAKSMKKYLDKIDDSGF